MQVSAKGIVIDSGGELELFGIAELKADISIDEQLWQLSGLLPLEKDSVVLENTQVADSAIVDLHMFIQGGDHWVVFLDNSETASKLQAEQQARLTEDFEQEGRKKSRG